MSSKTTSIENQAAGSGDNTSISFSERATSSSESPARQSPSDPGVKSGPEDLAQQINHSSAESGATVLVLDRDNQDRVEYITNKFILQAFQMQFKEKVQLLETFDSSSVSFFGDTAKVYQFSASAIDYPSTDSMYKTMHQSSIIDLYDKHLRGTQLLNANNIAVMRIMNHMIYGYPMRMNVNYSSSQDKFANFSLSWVVTNHILSSPGWVSEDELQRLYMPSGDLTDQQQRWVEILTALISTARRMMIITSDQEQSLDKIKNEYAQISISGLSINNQRVRINMLNLQRPTYELLAELGSWPQMQQIIDTRADELTQAIESKQSSSLGYKSPILTQWRENILDPFKSSASRATQEWSSFEEFQSHLVNLNSLIKQLQYYKNQIING